MSGGGEIRVCHEGDVVYLSLRVGLTIKEGVRIHGGVGLTIEGCVRIRGG